MEPLMLCRTDFRLEFCSLILWSVFTTPIWQLFVQLNCNRNSKNCNTSRNICLSCCIDLFQKTNELNLNNYHVNRTASYLKSVLLKTNDRNSLRPPNIKVKCWVKKDIIYLFFRLGQQIIILKKQLFLTIRSKQRTA